MRSRLSRAILSNEVRCMISDDRNIIPLKH
nr:MAG TPA: hypothetical protein [Bacteriophage sp.]